MTIADERRIRQLRPEDASAAQTLLGQLGYNLSTEDAAQRIGFVIGAPDHFAAVACHNDSIVGLVHAYVRPALEKSCEAVVQSLVVSPGRRNAGVGKSLMTAVETWARARGLSSVTLQTRIDRADARAFYEHIGYSHAATSHVMRREFDRP